MRQRAVFGFPSRVAADEERAFGVDAARPRIEPAELLERLPVLRVVEQEQVAFPLPRARVLAEFRGDDAVGKFRLDRDDRGHRAIEEMVDEMLALGVFPFARADFQRLLSERSERAIGEPLEGDFRDERAGLRVFGQRGAGKEKEGGKKSHHRQRGRRRASSMGRCGMAIPLRAVLPADRIVGSTLRTPPTLLLQKRRRRVRRRRPLFRRV